MFTGRRPRAFQFSSCVGTAILGQGVLGRKMELKWRRGDAETGETAIVTPVSPSPTHPVFKSVPLRRC